MGKLISVFGCGVQKGGTTSLHAHLCEHPGLSAPSRKEIHFFDDETNDWSAPDYSALDAFFHADDGDRLRFEITPIYMFWPPSIARIRAYNPSAKLIFLFRDPFDRAWSQWCMEYVRCNEGLLFGDAIREGRVRLARLTPLAEKRRTYSYVERGMYAKQVRRALMHFPREQLLFLRSEDLRDAHRRTLDAIARFIGIGPFPDSRPKREFSRPDLDFSCERTEADRMLIAELVHDDLREFAELTGLDLSAWPTMRANTAAQSKHR